MSFTTNVILTPQRKRAASGPFLEYYDDAASLAIIPDPDATPDVQSVPELVQGDDTPEPTALSPGTPSPPISPSPMSSSDRQSYGVQTRTKLNLRRSMRQIALRASQCGSTTTPESLARELESDIQKPRWLFPEISHPSLPKVKIEKPSHFNFSEQVKDLNEGTIAGILTFPAPRRQRGELLKRVKEQATTTNDNSQREIVAPHITQALSIKAEHSRRGPSDRGKGGAANIRFSRILPFDTIERLKYNPDQCVASLVSRPDERCSRLITPNRDVTPWLLTEVSKVRDPSNVADSESFILALVNMVTCTRYHRSIAQDQLERLVDRFHGRGSKGAGSKFDFTGTDMEAARCWLEALTKMPEDVDDQSVLPSQHTSRSLKVSGSTETVRVQVSLDSMREKAPQKASAASQTSATKFEIAEKATKIASALQMSEGNGDFEAGRDFMEATQTRETTKTFNVIEKTEIFSVIGVAEKHQTIGRTRSVKTTQSTETISTTGADQTNFGDSQIIKRSETVTVSPTDDNAILTTELTKKSVTEVQDKEKTGTITTTKHEKTVSSFRPPLIDEKTLAAALLKTFGRRQSDRADANKKSTKTQDLITLHQEFELYFPGNSGNAPVDRWIHERLVRPLTPREVAPGPRYPGQGIIYMYWVRGNFGFVKIGKTSGESTRRRLRDWERQCGQKVEEHTHGEVRAATAAPPLQLPHAWRVEALVHAELKDYRLRETSCKKCGRAHEKWFAVSPQDAQRVIEKWSRWMLTRPYAERGGRWCLKEDVDVSEIIKPIAISANQAISLPAPKKSVPAETQVMKSKARRKKSK